MSRPEIVHPLPVDEIAGWMTTLRRSLLNDPHGPEAVNRLHNRTRTWRADRVWGVRDRGAWVGTLATEARTLTVPGRGARTHDLAVDALTGVSVAATHRRRGLLRRMLDDSLRQARERGDALSVLIAAEWPIYGRFGYAPATVGARYRYHVRRAGAVPIGSEPGRLRPASTDELGTIADEVFAAARLRHAGQMDRADPWWRREFGLDGFLPMNPTPPNWLVHEDDAGRPDGLLAWHATGSLDLDGTPGTADVDLLVAGNDDAYRDLWGYLAGIDLVGEIVLHKRPVDEPIRWLLGDGRALQQFALIDELWVRLLDVPAALAARGYAIDGTVVLEVDDPDGGYGTGRFALEVRDGVASCAPTTAGADLHVSQRALASVYLGGHRLRAVAVAGGVDELSTGALARADLMFSTPTPPWNQTPF